jgi:hypothetical protein
LSLQDELTYANGFLFKQPKTHKNVLVLILLLF